MSNSFPSIFVKFFFIINQHRRNNPASTKWRSSAKAILNVDEMENQRVQKKMKNPSQDGKDWPIHYLVIHFF